MSIFEKREHCIGCGACVDVCPVTALELVAGEKGFYEPKRKDTCIDCHKCETVCPTLNNQFDRQDRSYYYGWIKDNEIRMRSTSGGAFSALAQTVLDSDGVVFGASYAKDFKKVIMSSTENEDIRSFQGSKYCQSDPDHLFTKIKNDISSGKQVMLVGTPCVIAAARNIFGNCESLLLVDFFCGGVVPQSVLRSYVSDLETRKRSKIIELNMRDKNRGWNKAHMTVRFQNGDIYSRTYHYDYYLHYFYTPYFKNEQCLTCPFVEHYAADITIGDYWSYRKEQIQNTEKGVSFVCANTEKGRKVVDKLSSSMELFQTDETNAAYAYKKKQYSAEQLKNREMMQKQYTGRNFVELAASNDFRHGIPGIFLKQIKNKIKKLIVSIQ